MAFSYTGIAYLLGFLAVGLLTFRFYQYWRKEKTIISKLFFYFAGSFAFFMLITGIAGLFFANNTQILRGVVIFAAFVQSLALAIIGYMIVYLKFPRISPWFGAGPIFLLGSVATILTAIIPFNPYLEPAGGINWDIQPLADTFRFSLFFITFIPLIIIIIIQQSKVLKDPSLKARTFGLGLGLLLGFFAGLFDFFLENMLNLGAISSDIAMGAMSIVVFIIVFLTQKAPPKEKKEYIPFPPTPKIPW